MMRHLLALLAVLATLAAGHAEAATCPALPNTLVNGTTADAAQVMANFNALLSCFNNNILPAENAIFPESPPYNAAGNGISDDSAALQSACAAATAAAIPLVLRQKYFVAQTIALACPVAFMPGAYVAPATAHTLTLSSWVEAGLSEPIFQGLGTVSVTTSPLVSGQWFNTAATPCHATTLAPSTSCLGYQLTTTLDHALTSDTRSTMFATSLSVTGAATSTNIWENLNSFVELTSGTANGELNMVHGYFQVDAGAIAKQVEVFESSALNSGTISTEFDNYLASVSNGAAGTVTGSLNGFKLALSQANAGAGSITQYNGIDMEAMTGGGSVPTTFTFLRNAEARAAIVTLGKVAIGQLGVPDATQQVLIQGSDNAAGTYPLTIKNLATTNVLVAGNDGTVLVNGLQVAGTAQLGNTNANFATAFGGGAGVAPRLSAENSGDTNIRLRLVGKGSSGVTLETGAATILTAASTGITIGGNGTLLTTSVALTDNTGAQAATLTNGPTAGNPTKWIPINDNGTTRNIPAW